MNSWNPYFLIAFFFVLVLLATWLAGGRRLTAPAGETVTVTSSRFFSLLYFLFWGFLGQLFATIAIHFLFLASDDEIGGYFIRRAAGSFALLLASLLLLAALLDAIRLIVPDYVKVSADGVACRTAGRLRHWPWRDIEGARLRSLKGPLILALNRISDSRWRWPGRNPHEVTIWASLRPTAVLESGAMAALRPSRPGCNSAGTHKHRRLPRTNSPNRDRPISRCATL